MAGQGTQADPVYVIEEGGGGSATLTGATVTIGATAAVIVAAKASRASIVVQNVHATNVLYVGPSSVTTANGLRLNPGESIEFTDYTGAIYGIASAAGTDVRYLEVG